MTVKRLTKDSILLALLIVSAYMNVRFPFSEVAFTLQILMVIVITFSVPLLDSTLIIFGYIIMGLIGIPVFTNGGGFSYIFSPTFGYILGFLAMPATAKLVTLIPIKQVYIKRLIAAILSLIVVYIFGSIYFYCIKTFYIGKGNSSMTFFAIVQLCVLPFIPFDLLKIIGGLAVVQQLEKVQPTAK